MVRVHDWPTTGFFDLRLRSRLEEWCDSQNSRNSIYGSNQSVNLMGLMALYQRHITMSMCASFVCQFLEKVCLLLLVRRLALRVKRHVSKGDRLVLPYFNRSY